MLYIVLQICHSKKVFGTKNNVKFRTFFFCRKQRHKANSYLRLFEINRINTNSVVGAAKLHKNVLDMLIFYNRSKRVVIHSTVYLVKFYSKHKNDIYIVILFLILVQLIRLECSERIIYNFISSITYVQYLFKNN